MARNKKASSTTTANTTTAIEGNVVLKVVKGKSVIKEVKTHNYGTVILFIGIIQALSQADPINNLRLPRYLGVGTSNTVGSETDTGLQSEVSMVRPALQLNYKGVQSTNSSASATYQGLVPYNNIGMASINEIGVFGTSSGASLLARVILPETLKLDPGESLIVEWSFSVSNKSASSTTDSSISTSNESTEGV